MQTSKQGESVSQFLAELRKLASTCKFGSQLNGRLRDQLIFGLLSAKVQQTLFTKSDTITLDETVAIAQSYEISEQCTVIIRGSENTANTDVSYVKHTTQSGFQQRFQKKKPSVLQEAKPAKQKSGCPNCGSTDHKKVKDCPHKSVTCYSCLKKGHFAKMCRSGTGKQSPHNASHLEVNSSLSNSHRSPKINVVVQVNGIPHDFEFDTGCEKSLLSVDFWRNCLRSPSLVPTTTSYKSYTGQTFVPVGNLKTELKYEDQLVQHTIPVVQGHSLFGRDLMKMFAVNWSDIRNQCNSVKASQSLNSLLKEFSDIFG